MCYLEISGRGTGKTYRLIEAVRRYVAQDEKNMANVIVTNERCAEYIKKQLEKNSFTKSSQVRFTTPERKNAVVRGYGNVKNFFDEFDCMGFTVKKNDPFFWGNFYDDYYVTTPSKIRHLGRQSTEELAKTDFLMRLLMENNYGFVSFVGCGSPDFYQIMKEKIGEEAFQQEFEGKFLKY